MSKEPNLDKREKRTPEQMRQHHKHYIYVHDDVWECLRRHAYRFRIAPARLTRDILTAWASIFTDWDDKTFVEGVEPLNFIPLPPEPQENYLARLGFAEPTND